MSHTVPDSWQIIKIQLEDGQYLYKVFAGWYGSYTSGDSWQINSGVVSYDIGDDFVNFHGASGSTYVCNLKYEGHLSSYCRGILDQILDKVQGKAYVITFEDFVKEFKV